MERVCQVLPNLEYGDAISNFALLIHRLLRASGYDCHLYAQYIHPEYRGICQPLHRAGAVLRDEKTYWLYHYSTSSAATQQLAKAAGPVVLLYHNVTPASFSAGLGGGFASRAYAGRRELTEFAPIPVVAAAISEYNARDLRGLGFNDVRVVPLAIDFDSFDRGPNRRLLRALRSAKAVNFLTVGRIAPHKKLEDVIKVFYYYQNYINPRSWLYIVGEGEEFEPYTHQLRQLIEDLGIPNIQFTGKVRFRDLLAYYKAADAYLCMSEHEGFCVPLVESMYLGVPVIANGTEAIRETMGEAGILIREKRADVIAETADQIIHDARFRTRLINCQKDRALDFQVDRLANDIVQLLAEARARSSARDGSAAASNGRNGAAKSQEAEMAVR